MKGFLPNYLLFFERKNIIMEVAGPVFAFAGMICVIFFIILPSMQYENSSATHQPVKTANRIVIVQNNRNHASGKDF